MPVVRLVTLLLLSFGLAGAASESLTVYTGRSKAFVEPLITRYQAETGATVKVRYGKDAELLAALAEEAGRGSADLFWANTGGALGQATSQGFFIALPESLTERAALAPSSRRWMPLSVRFRALAHHTERMPADHLPDSVLDLPKHTALAGRIGWTPTYSSFHDFVTALRLQHGDDTARAWLRGMKALQPKAYTANNAMLQAVVAGEIDVALTNHYYVERYIAGGFPVAAHFFRVGDAGSLPLVTGIGVLASSKQPEAAHRLIDWLLSPAAQQAVPNELCEYPVINGIDMPDRMLSADEVTARGIGFDQERLRELAITIAMLRAEGLL